MKQIPLSRGLFALVDDADFDNLSAFKWSALKAPRTFYAVRRSNGKYIYMHREILGITDSKIHTDHRDHDGRNNQRENIRGCTQHQNIMNIQPYKIATSKYKGVCLYKGKWLAQIKANGRNYSLGSYCSEIKAAMAYNAAAIKYHGEFAYLNKIP